MRPFFIKWKRKNGNDGNIAGVCGGPDAIRSVHNDTASKPHIFNSAFVIFGAGPQFHAISLSTHAGSLSLAFSSSLGRDTLGSLSMLLGLLQQSVSARSQ